LNIYSGSAENTTQKITFSADIISPSGYRRIKRLTRDIYYPLASCKIRLKLINLMPGEIGNQKDMMRTVKILFPIMTSYTLKR
jgi:hypothetical protein